MDKQNIRIWNEVSTTATEATKRAKVGGMEITAINGLYMVKRATEVFGPIGIGWGYDVVEERFDQGAPIKNDKGEDIGITTSHVIRLKLWFETEGKRGEITHYGCTPAIYKSKYGVTVDDEAPKKSLTDAIKKCLSMLGFSADVYMGLHDDSDYVKNLQEQESIEKADDKDAAIMEHKKARAEWLQEAVALIGTATSKHEASMLRTKFLRQVERRGEEKFTRRIEEAFTEKVKEFE